jgi:hypothetical protein
MVNLHHRVFLAHGLVFERRGTLSLTTTRGGGGGP